MVSTTHAKYMNPEDKVLGYRISSVIRWPLHAVNFYSDADAVSEEEALKVYIMSYGIWNTSSRPKGPSLRPRVVVVGKEGKRVRG